MVLETKFSNDEVSILILKSITKKEEDGLKSTLIDHYVGVQTPSRYDSKFKKINMKYKRVGFPSFFPKITSIIQILV